MEATELMPVPARFLAQERLEEELTTLAAHISAATARWLELVLEFREEGVAAIDGVERWLAFRCGISAREAREYVRVAEALQESYPRFGLPLGAANSPSRRCGP